MPTDADLFRAGLAIHAAGLSGLDLCAADVHMRRGLALCQQGDQAAALAQFDSAVRADPSLADAHNNRGAVRLAMGDVRGAFEDYDAALRLKPNYAEALNNRGAARQSIGDMDGARADFDRAVRLKPDYAQAYDNRGVWHSYHWDHAAAIADFDAALRLYGEGPEWRGRVCALLVCRANSRYHLKDRLGALMDFRRAATLDADLFAASVVDSIQALMRKNLKLALADCDQHLRTDPDDYFSYLRRGVIARLLGRREEARADWERCARSFDGGEDAVLAVFIIGKCGDAEDVAFAADAVERLVRRRDRTAAPGPRRAA